MNARTVIAFAAGLVFGVGLLVSGMTVPAKVIGFLDVTRSSWDPTLAFVMGGAVMVHALGYRLVMRRSHPLFDGSFHVPSRKDLDRKLIAGSALFGAGWGLAGYCPGPAIVSAASGAQSALVFVAAMIAGMLVQRLMPRAPVA